MAENRRIIRMGGVCGLVGTLLYLTIAVADQFLWPEANTTREFLAVMGRPQYGRLNMAFHFLMAAAAFLWMAGFLGLNRLLKQEQTSFAVRVGTLFGVIACAVMVEMMIVQGSVMVKMGQSFLSARDEAERQTAVIIYRGLRDIDYGLDLTFDVFFFIGWMLLATVMLRHASFGKLIGGIGLVVFALATGFNLWSAPDPPAFDIGPLGALWLLAVYIKMLRPARFTSESPRIETG